MKIKPLRNEKLLKIQFCRYLLAFALTGFMFPVFAQQVKDSGISVSVQNESLRNVFEQITSATGYTFMYDEKNLQGKPGVTLQHDNATLETILADLSRQTKLYFSPKGSTILVSSTRQGAADDRSASFTVTGKVVDENGEAVIGATILQKGTTNGTITDLDGGYSIKDIRNGDVITVTYVGYHPKNVSIKEEKPYNITIYPADNELDEVVVVGYGVQQKRDVTTAIASLRASDLKNSPVNSLEQALTGKLAGVQISQSSGMPGGGTSIKVRGTGSITAGTDPLYVIDGFPMSDYATEGTGMTINPLSGLDMNDVESIEILKDASAAAIYGSRGANGVVIITTKQGSEGRPVVKYDGFVGWQQTTKKLDMLNAYEYADLSYEAHNNAYLDLLESKGITGGSIFDTNEQRLERLGVKAGTTNVTYLIPEEIMPYVNGEPGLPDYNWQDAVLRTGVTHKHSLSVSGGTKAVNYYISGSYADEEGIVIGTGQETYGGRAKIKVKHKNFRFGTNIGISHILYDLVPTENRYQDETIVASALISAPVMPIYDENGDYSFDHYRWSYKQPQVINPVALANLKEDRMTRNKVMSSTFAEWDIIKGLRLKTEFGTDFNSFRRNQYRPSSLPTTVNKTPPSIPEGTTRTKDNFSWIWENTLSFDRTFKKKHSLSALLGHTVQKEMLDASRITATGFPNDLVPTLNASTVATTWDSSRQVWSLVSVLARVQYNYKHKYMLSGAVRTDGSSRFGSNNRWGVFPSASAGWYLSEEEWLKDVTWLTSLKLRASYGISGNFSIGNYEYYSNLSQDGYVFGDGVGSLVTGLYPSTEGNPDLGWEKTAMTNLGLDIGLFDMIRLEVDVYNSNTSDMLLKVRVPEISGYSTVRKNVGKVNNKGFELTLSTNNAWGDFRWNNSFNFSLNRNKVLDLGGPKEMVDVYENVLYFVTRVGEPIGNYYTLVTDGVFKNEEEVRRGNDLNDKSIAKVEGAKPGDYKFVDQDDNGIITSDDKAITGNYMPDFTYGFSTQLSYKFIDLSVSLQGVYGNEIANIYRRYINNMEGGGNNMGDARNRWRSEEDPGNGNTVRANRSATGMNGQISTWHIEDGSYLRIRDITLGLTLPKEWSKAIGVSNLRCYFTAYNPFTFTKYSGYNPEVSNSKNPLTPGIDYGTYPLSKSCVFGLNVSF